MIRFEEIEVGSHFRLQVWVEGEDWWDEEEDELVIEEGSHEFPIARKRDTQGYTFKGRYHELPPDTLVHTL